MFFLLWGYFQQAYFPPQIHISIISVQRMLCEWNICNVNENVQKRKTIGTHCHNYLKIYRCLNCKCIELKISRKTFQTNSKWNNTNATEAFFPSSFRKRSAQSISVMWSIFKCHRQTNWTSFYRCFGTKYHFGHFKHR